jgi:hypothetical protein
MKTFNQFINESTENDNFGKVLTLILKGEWFKMIASGEKKEEYRNITPYWDKRLDNKKYDTVKFRLGYETKSPVVWLECKGIKKGGEGNPKWGWDEECYIIKLGKILKTENYNK